MIEDFSYFCFEASIGLALISIFLPIFLVWRAAGISVCLFVSALIFDNPSVSYRDDPVGEMGIWFILLFFVGYGLLLLIRFGIAAVRSDLELKTFAGPRNSFMNWVDLAMLVVLGVTLGLYQTFYLANTLSGMDLGVRLDIGIAIAAVVVAALFLLILKRKYSAVVSTAFLTLAVIAFAGSLQADRIFRSAEAFAKGKPWCLSASDSIGRITSIEELGFFSLPKADSVSHLNLLIRDSSKPLLVAHWSVRNQNFENASWGRPGVASCHPVIDFETVLKSGTINRDAYAVGQKVYSVPQSYHPRAYTDRLELLSDLLVKRGSLELNYGLRRPHSSYIDKTLSDMPSLEALKSGTLPENEGEQYKGKDEQKERDIVIDCRNGYAADDVCSVHVYEKQKYYRFTLLPDQIHQWAGATERVEKLFKSLQMQ
nr:hypothetical protein [uncultured Cohaesibacter sp.]